MKVGSRSDLGILLVGFLLTGLPLALGQLTMTAALSLNRKTGQMVILTGIPVFIGYIVSYFKYGEQVKPLELTGSLLILVGLLGVINCGGEVE